MHISYIIEWSAYIVFHYIWHISHHFIMNYMCKHNEFRYQLRWIKILLTKSSRNLATMKDEGNSIYCIDIKQQTIISHLLNSYPYATITSALVQSRGNDANKFVGFSFSLLFYSSHEWKYSVTITVQTRIGRISRINGIC